MTGNLEREHPSEGTLAAIRLALADHSAMVQLALEVAERFPPPQIPTPAAVGDVIYEFVCSLEKEAFAHASIRDAFASIGSLDKVDWDFVGYALVTTGGRLGLNGISPDEARSNWRHHVNEGIDLALGL